MLTKLTFAAALVLCSASAMAQTPPAVTNSGDIRQDQTQMQRDNSQLRTDNSLAAHEGSDAASLRRRAAHETGLKRKEDLATAARLSQHSEMYQDRAQGAEAQKAAAAKDIHSDETQSRDQDKPH